MTWEQHLKARWRTDNAASWTLIAKESGAELAHIRRTGGAYTWSVVDGATDWQPSLRRAKEEARLKYWLDHLPWIKETT